MFKELKNDLSQSEAVKSSRGNKSTRQWTRLRKKNNVKIKALKDVTPIILNFSSMAILCVKVWSFSYIQTIRVWSSG